MRYLQGCPEPWSLGETDLCSSRGAAWPTEDPAVPLGQWCTANCRRQETVMQPSSSKEHQHPSWLNAQTCCAMEAGRCHLARQTRGGTEVQAPPAPTAGKGGSKRRPGKSVSTSPQDVRARGTQQHWPSPSLLFPASLRSQGLGVP